MTATANMDLLKRQRTFSIDETREQVRTKQTGLWMTHFFSFLHSLTFPTIFLLYLFCCTFRHAIRVFIFPFVSMLHFYSFPLCTFL